MKNQKDAPSTAKSTVRTTPDLDGLAKNWDKLKKDWLVLRKEMPPHLLRLLKRPWDMHAYVNIFKEAHTCAPYFTSHVDAVAYPALISAIFVF